MNNLFTNVQDAKVNRIQRLQMQADALVQQRKSVKWDKTLKDQYTISISYVLSAIKRLANEIEAESEKATDGNQ